MSYIKINVFNNNIVCYNDVVFLVGNGAISFRWHLQVAPPLRVGTMDNRFDALHDVVTTGVGCQPTPDPVFTQHSPIGTGSVMKLSWQTG